MGELDDGLQVALRRGEGADGLQHYGGHFTLVLLQEVLQAVEVGLAEGDGGAREDLGDAHGADAGDEVGEVEVVGRLVPVVPAVVAGEEDDVLAGGPAGDPRREGAGLAAALRVSDHLGAGDGVDQLLGELDLLGAVDGVYASPVDLLLDGVVDDVIVVSQDDGADGVDPVDVLVAVDVDEPGALGAVGVDRADALDRRQAAPELGVARDELAGSLVYLQRPLDAFVSGHSDLPAAAAQWRTRPMSSCSIGAARKASVSTLPKRAGLYISESILVPPSTTCSAMSRPEAGL